MQRITSQYFTSTFICVNNVNVCLLCTSVNITCVLLDAINANTLNLIQTHEICTCLTFNKQVKYSDMVTRNHLCDRKSRKHMSDTHIFYLDLQS